MPIDMGTRQGKLRSQNLDEACILNDILSFQGLRFAILKGRYDETFAGEDALTDVLIEKTLVYILSKTQFFEVPLRLRT